MALMLFMLREQTIWSASLIHTYLYLP